MKATLFVTAEQVKPAFGKWLDNLLELFDDHVSLSMLFKECLRNKYQIPVKCSY